MVVLTAVLRARPGCEEQVAAALVRLQAAVRQEPGNLAYRVHRQKDRPGTFFVYERYRDEEAFRAHREAPHMSAIMGPVRPLLEGPAELTFYEDLAGDEASA